MLLKQNHRYNRPYDGYSLYFNGSRKFVDLPWLKELVDKHFKQKEEKMGDIVYANLGNKLKSEQFIIGSQHKVTGLFSASTNPGIHNSKIAACKEAERLAGNDADKRFVVLQVVGVVTNNQVVWE